MTRFIFPIIVAIGLILVKFGPELFSSGRRVFPDATIALPKATGDVATATVGRVPSEGMMDDLLRTFNASPINEPTQALIGVVEASPAFRAFPVSSTVVEGPRYSLGRISSEVSQVGIQNIRDFTEYVDSTHSVLTTVPRDEQEFMGVFGRIPSASESAALSSEFEFVSQSYIHMSGRDQLLLSISESGDNFLTIVGHNEGGVLRLPSGETVAIQDIAQQCSSFHKKCIFLSCNSEDYLGTVDDEVFGVDRQITFRGAHMIAQLLVERMSRQRSSSYLLVSDDLRSDLSRLAQAANLSESISASLPPVFVAGGIGGVYLTVESDKK